MILCFEAAQRRNPGLFMPLLSLPSKGPELPFVGLEVGVQKAIAQEEISIKVAKALLNGGSSRSFSTGSIS
jgi:hypothetical protein